MCHSEIPAGQVTPDVAREEVRIPLPGGDTLPALLARAAAADAPSVLLVHDIFGRTPFYEDLAARLAAAGFNALLPDCFCRLGGLPEATREAAFARYRSLDEPQTLLDLHAALDWLADRAGAPRRRLGTMGFCMGGTLVLDLAAERGDLATVCYYGFPVMGEHTPGRAAPEPITLVDRMRGPIIGFWGDQDTLVGLANVQRFATALRAREVEYTQTIYPGAGHGFMSASRFDPAHEAYAAATDAWAQTLAFYRTHLARPAVAPA
ncbi:MAG TPA: dienelactone hydrolase family protein [Chloroflexota bacterium]|nr:dienelactone hydrolase family protein [Chloroflexota bacterium]